ncbi:MAG: hypothetical protein ACD_33C00045G0008 [uncultured bacterium]|nr:MAG: hypothetical protein ACD_33C00045G0008 [uncultured bacterium]
MFIQTKRKFLLIKQIIEKYIMILIFTVLPKSVTCAYVNLSILALFYHIKDKTFSVDSFNNEKFKQLLHMTLNNEILLLPEHTFKWIWNDRILNSTIIIHGKKMKLIDAIKDDDISNHNLKTIITHMLKYLPNLFKIKLKLNKCSSKILIKNKITRTVMYNF